jgi:hypothetical protein
VSGLEVFCRFSYRALLGCTYDWLYDLSWYLIVTAPLGFFKRFCYLSSQMI